MDASTCKMGYHDTTSIFYHSAALYCSMGIAGYVSVYVQLYCVGFHCFTICFGLYGHLQVCSIFYFHMLEGFCFTVFFLPFFPFTWSNSAYLHFCCGDLPKEPPTCYATDTKVTPLRTVTKVTTRIRGNAKIRVSHRLGWNKCLLGSLLRSI
jgi:hypothetical protein